MSLILLGIASSIATKLVTFINNRLSGTVLEGRGAFFIALIVSLGAGTYQVASTTGFNLADWQSIVVTLATVWSISEAFFQVVVKKLDLTV